MTGSRSDIVERLPRRINKAHDVSELAIHISQVNKSFGAVRAVRDLNLDVPIGSLCGFLGPNGAGKSTTIRMIMSIIYPDSGGISVLGGSALQTKDRIGFLPEERGLYRKMRVGEFLAYIGKLKGAPARGLDDHIQSWLDRMELPGVFHRRCQELSKGMQQKVQVLAAIIHDPDLIILDEPFSGLDPVNTALLTRIVRELHAQGKTVIFSTHVLQQAEELCERIFLINHGVKLLDATMDEIRTRFDPRTIVVEPRDDCPGLETIPGVKTASRLNGTGAMELTIDDDADPQSVIRDIVVRFPVRAVELRQPTLTDVFVQLVMKDEGADAAKAAREQLSHV